MRRIGRWRHSVFDRCRLLYFQKWCKLAWALVLVLVRALEWLLVLG